MRIQEERERRELQARHLARLPGALKELYDQLSECVQAYTESFGANSASLELLPSEALPSRIQVTVRDERGGDPGLQVNVVCVPEMPGFRIERGEQAMDVEVGLLPSDKLFYRDRELDKYLTMEEFTRRILDRVLFPGLREQ